MDKSARYAFAERLRAGLNREGISQVELARKLEVSKNSVSAWATGRSMPASHHLPVLARTLGVSVDAMFGLDLGSNKPSEAMAIVRRLAESELDGPLQQMEQGATQLRELICRARASTESNRR